MVSLEIFIDIILPATLWPLVEPASNRNEYQDYLLGGNGGRCLGLLTTLPPSCTNYLEILGASISWSLKSPKGLLYMRMTLVFLISSSLTYIYTEDGSTEADNEEYILTNNYISLKPPCALNCVPIQTALKVQVTPICPCPL